MYHKWQSYDVWFLRYGVWQTEFFVILDHFLPFYPPNNPKNQNFEKMKKILQILLFYTSVPQMTMIWYMVPEIWSVMDRIFLSFWTIFWPFYSPNNPNNQNFEKLKKIPEDIIILDKCSKNHDHMLYCSLDMVHNRFNYFSFWAIFYPFTSLTVQKIKI